MVGSCGTITRKTPRQSCLPPVRIPVAAARSICASASASRSRSRCSLLLAIVNPTDPLSHFATVCKPGSDWHVIRVGAFDTPVFTG